MALLGRFVLKHATSSFANGRFWREAASHGVTAEQTCHTGELRSPFDRQQKWTDRKSFNVINVIFGIGGII
jgi:hypothetical protein